MTDPDQDRFEIRVDGVEAGHAEYVRKGDLVIFTHTEIDDAFEGRGLGSKLARGALDAVRATGDPIVPLCPFIAVVHREAPRVRGPRRPRVPRLPRVPREAPAVVRAIGSASHGTRCRRGDLLIGDIFRAGAAAVPDRVAAALGDRAVTYREAGRCGPNAHAEVFGARSASDTATEW